MCDCASPSCTLMLALGALKCSHTLAHMYAQTEPQLRIGGGTRAAAMGLCARTRTAQSGELGGGRRISPVAMVT